MNYRVLLLFVMLLLPLQALAIDSIAILVSEQVQASSVSKLAIDDAVNLLQQACECKVSANSKAKSAQVLIDLALSFEPREEKELFAAYTGTDKVPALGSKYTWTGVREDRRYRLELNTDSPHGLSNALYGLLQEQLGFKFYHVRETLIPTMHEWPLKDGFEMKAEAEFDKRGFHVHTMHPIEMTEPLLDQDFEGGREIIREYIDWLARNQQNFFEFNLLESVDLKPWLPYAKEMVDYAHERGILIGLDLSLHMIQQKAYMLYRNKPNSFRSKRAQMERNLEKLFSADWDFLNVEFSTTEYHKGNAKKKYRLQSRLLFLLQEKYAAKLLGRKHVVKAINDDIIADEDKAHKDAQKLAEDRDRIMLIHTVMFYGLKDKRAPVYGNENLSGMNDLLLREKDKREAWYFPESAYWVTFDVNVPMLLLPYLSERLEDIEYVSQLNVPGHVTFSSGWEWGYWLVDWSIARWSWSFTYGNEPENRYPAQYFDDLFPEPDLKASFQSLCDLQEDFIKDQELIQYMAGVTITDELPGALNMQFHPRPDHTPKWLTIKAEEEQIEFYSGEAAKLRSFAARNQEQISLLRNVEVLAADVSRSKILSELVDGLEITGLRAAHRAAVMLGTLDKRSRKLNLDPSSNLDSLLEEAASARSTAQELVDGRRALYRYDQHWLDGWRRDHTAYKFGYLYTVKNLHFWKREEEQLRRGKYSPWFMNIWDVWRISGIL